MAKKTIEQSLANLEKIVEELESGDLPLEKALKRFEDGMKLSTWCAAKLDETEQKINILIQNQENADTETSFFDAENE